MSTITPQTQEAITLLGLQGEALNDLEKTRIATFNRIGALQRLGLSDQSPVLETANAIGDGLTLLEKRAKKDLQSALKGLGPSIHEFVQEARGVGEPQAARLLAVIGHPCWRYDNDKESPTYEQWLPRTVGQLWSYCGYAVTLDGEAPRRKKGEQSHFNTAARMRAYLIAESCVKAVAAPGRPKGHYRDVYEAARAKYKDAMHEHVCPRCGPKGQPAQPGSVLSDGHQHARALRIVAKEVLKDLWIAGQEN